MTETLATRDATDIVEILQFLAYYVSNRAASIERIDRVLNQGLVTAKGKNLFADRFAYLNTTGLTPAQVYDETLATVFNAPAGGQLYVEQPEQRPWRGILRGRQLGPVRQRRVDLISPGRAVKLLAA